MSTATKVHVFEEAGLGVAPFEFIKVIKQHGSNCMYCGTGITYNCIIQDSQGRRFIVGNVCVGKTDDSGLIKVVDEQTKEFKRQEAENRVKAAVEVYEARPEIKTVLRQQEHPNFADKTLLDYVEYVLTPGVSGASGQLKAARAIEKAVAALEKDPALIDMVVVKLKWMDDAKVFQAVVNDFKARGGKFISQRKAWGISKGSLEQIAKAHKVEFEVVWQGTLEVFEDTVRKIEQNS